MNNGLSIKTNFVNLTSISNLATDKDEIFCTINYRAKLIVSLSGKL